MKSYRKELWFNLPSRRGFANIALEVEFSIRESGIKEGLVLVKRKFVTPPPPEHSYLINRGTLNSDCKVSGLFSKIKIFSSKQNTRLSNDSFQAYPHHDYRHFCKEATNLYKR